MNILFIGDINGRIGRLAVKKILPSLIKEQKVDFTIANAENAAHGAGVTESIVNELMEAGVDFITTGDHAFGNRKHLKIFENYPILRPANFSKEIPGRGYAVHEHKGQKILIINLIGQVFMGMSYENPFHKLDEILADNNLQAKNLFAIIDIHAEATSEKVAFGHYANGRAAAVLGTHTHIMTADAEIKNKGTAYITDVGMVGAANECLGVVKEDIIKTFLTQIKYPHIIPEKGRAIFNAVIVKVNKRTGKATDIKPVTKFVEIK